jgi:hypothetical protein
MLRLQAARRSPGAVKVTLKVPESVSTGAEGVHADCPAYSLYSTIKVLAGGPVKLCVTEVLIPS